MLKKIKLILKRTKVGFQTHCLVCLRRNLMGKEVTFSGIGELQCTMEITPDRDQVLFLFI